MIVITTPTGHIGSKVLEQLIKTDEKLRVIVRDPAKLSDEVREKAEIIQGSHDDPAVLAEAYDGADDLFYVVPPSMQYADVDEYYTQFAAPTCAAVDKYKVKRIVFVSGTAVEVAKDTGAMAASVLVERMLEATTAATRVLYCGTFMENLLHSVPAIAATGKFSTSVPGDLRLPWVATGDIADVAVRLLRDKAWSGKDSLGVLGPEDLSYDEIAGVMSEVLGRETGYETISGEALVARTMQFGASRAAAQALADIYRSMVEGTFNLVPRTAENSSPTGFREWCGQVLKPAVN